MAEENIASILGRPKLLSDLSMDEIEYLVKLMEIKNINENEDIFEEGSPGNEFYIIVSGSVWVRKKDSLGKEHQITVISCGECFGEMALIDEMPRSASVRALENSRVAVLRRPVFMKNETGQYKGLLPYS